jgi:hypothetical protein
MHVLMFMLQFFVFVLVRMLFGQVQPQANTHQSRSPKELDRDWVLEEKHCRGSTNKGRHGKVSSGSGCAYVAQGKHEEHEAHTVAEKANDESLQKQRQGR